MPRKTIYDMDFAEVYDMLVKKVERKGKNPYDLHEAASWLLGYTAEELADYQNMHMTYGQFIENAPHPNADRNLIQGKICGVDIESIEEPVMQDVRRLDKMCDDIAKGKKKLAWK